jgi:5-methylcytosine-specific restriction endonuclease McrA
MRNLEIYNKESFTFYTDFISKKRNPKDDLNYKTRLDLMNDQVSERYKFYDEKYDANLLQEIDPKTYTGEENRDLLSLYRFGAKKLVDLKVTLTTTKTNRISNDCQNCTIGEVGSFDHYLPKDIFPEYAINPKNLIPSCSKCNSFKGINWKQNGKRLFLNPYLDILPEKQYLFVEINVDKNDLDIKFQIDNRNGLPIDLFEILESHYTRLYLCSRFSENCERAINEVKTEILKYSQKLSFDEIKETIIECADDNRKMFGYNHYIYLLQIALVNNSSFIEEYVGLKPINIPA